MRVKLCGIRSRRELEVAIAAGADAIGLVHGVSADSRHALEIEEVRELALRVPPYVSSVLVTELTDAEDLRSAMARSGCDTLQVHASPEDEESLDQSVRALGPRGDGLKIIRAISVDSELAIERAIRSAKTTRLIQLDSSDGARLGGTGSTHDWQISRRITDLLAPRGVSIVLSGGLDGGNVREAIRVVRPWAVDVSSGIENESGQKDIVRAAAFVRAARGLAGTPSKAP